MDMLAVTDFPDIRFKCAVQSAAGNLLVIPREGDYLFRIEHVALHSASAAGGAQFYISCAQVHVSGGSGSAQPKDLVSFPGAYKATDPGLMINIYNMPSNFTGYQARKCPLSS